MTDKTGVLTSKQSNAVLAGNAFVARFKREPVSPSDAAWLNGFVIALESNTSETCDVRQPIPVKEIVVALEREANGVPLTDPRWLAAGQLREMADWRNRTLMCRIDMRPPQIVEATAPKANSCVCGEPNSPGTHRTDGPCLAPIGDRR